VEEYNIQQKSSFVESFPKEKKGGLEFAAFIAIVVKIIKEVQSYSKEADNFGRSWKCGCADRNNSFTN